MRIIEYTTYEDTKARLLDLARNEIKSVYILDRTDEVVRFLKSVRIPGASLGEAFDLCADVREEINRDTVCIEPSYFFQGPDEWVEDEHNYMRDEYRGNIVVHVPHASVLFPQFCKKSDFRIDDLADEINKVTDWYCDELFNVDTAMFVAPWSRLVYDMERFPDDNEEKMSEKGLGLIYTKTVDGRQLRVLPKWRTPPYLASYRESQREFCRMVRDRIEDYGNCVIIDGHSFPDEPFPYEERTVFNRPDICIGTDRFHTPPELRDAAFSAFRDAGYSVAVNFPYSGALVPYQLYKADSRAMSVMIEVNRRLYLTDDLKRKPDEFEKIRKIIEKLTYEIPKLKFEQ